MLYSSLKDKLQSDISAINLLYKEEVVSLSSMY